MPDTTSPCDGCAKTAVLTLFDNDRSYCLRCAEEVVAFGWAKPVLS